MKLLVPAVIFVVYMDYICLTVSGKDICRLPKKIGPCEALIPRWYYDYRTNRCVKFNYGGCRGNQNNFRSKCECMRRCPRTETSPCKLPKVSGPCKAYFRRWYFNHKTRKCERFVYGGCGGNKNKFRSLAACQRKCPVTTANICKLPKVTGPCRARNPRWYFNYKTKRCERFIYGGCRGNRNNFRSLAGCQRKCPEKSCPTICYLLYAPVCGTDGKTYSNSCFLRIATCKSRGRITKAGDGPCLSTTANICKLPKVTGPCRARIPRWYFNDKTKRCERFIYGGCRGNKNNFKSLAGCQGKCPEKSCQRICSLLYAPVCGTDGKTYSNSCFLRIATCKSRGRITKAGDGPCLSNICKLPKVTGPCRARIPRWYFNYNTKRCERFIYGGCRGNKNNFTSLTSCQKKCPERPCPRFCPLIHAPVCGSDGKMYSNNCFLRIAICQSRGKITRGRAACFCK